MDRGMTPSWRKPVGMLIILALIAVWCVAIASLSAIMLSLAFQCSLQMLWHTAKLQPKIRRSMNHSLGTSIDVSIYP